ncbi:peptidylprolyl isomerase [Nostoc sp. FACHB-110]|uniref:peptidylprolyl isomerase n=1 Tax=Nostoc sp. FACHB-110 TaxID=2692834 RepID=UPI001683F19E|nr:peptidylprolyl isomerase [Nostoc sp. FACHB-110]MBD2439633.1 peptidylprolyl isomerase [Nostoc sp. FACHB-110]
MTEVLQIGNRTIKTAEIIPLLAGYQMLPQLQRELIIDEAIASIECTPEEVTRAQQQFYNERQLKTDDDIKAWMVYHGITVDQLESVTIRRLKIEKFKLVTWGNKLEAYFFQNKAKLDKVIYSLLRTQDIGLIQELYFRLQAKEQSFAEIAKEYSQGPEAQTNGLVGPIEIQTLHPAMMQLLSSSQPGQVMPPARIAEWIVIIRLEKLIPAQLDDAMKARLLNELFESWLQEQQRQIQKPIN